MPTDREVMQQALDALEYRESKEWTVLGRKAIEALRTQLAKPDVPDGVIEHAEIYVGEGLFAVCDWSDWGKVRSYNWNLTTRNKTLGAGCLYAQAWSSNSTGSRNRVTMHQLIMQPPKGLVVDHINGNGLDNRRENLRLVTHQENSFNQHQHGGSSKYCGVCYRSDTKSWRAYITKDGARTYLGSYANEVEAALEYDRKAKELFGEYAKLNFD
jgi:hypothetical protein